jgi:DNA-binding NarL/FixJ family response regulator
MTAGQRQSIVMIQSGELMTPIRILIVDDYAALRRTTRMMLDTEPTIKIVGEAKDGRQAVCQVKNLSPDIVLMDLIMPPENGAKAIAAIKRDYPETRIIALIPFLDSMKIGEALAAGAEGCLLKDGDGEMLLRALYVVSQGGILPDPRFTRHSSRHQPEANTYQAH